MTKRISLPLADWPPDDRAMWAAIVADGDLLEDAGSGSAWRRPTRRSRLQAYGAALTFLAGRGWLDPSADPADRFTPERVAAYIDVLRARVAPLSAWSQIDKLCAVLAAGRPDRDWRWLRRVVGRLKAMARPVRPIAPRLIPSSEIFSAACSAMDAIEAALPREHRFGDASAHYRDALMVALLAARPLRRRTLSVIEIGRHLIEGKSGFRLMFDGEDTKTGDTITFPLPDALVPFMRRYIDHHRPRLLRGAATPALWVTQGRLPLSINGIGTRVKAATRRILGRVLTPHLFRHAAATSTAIAAPAEARLIRGLLGHRTLAMADKTYNKAGALDAGRKYHALLQDNELAPRRRRDGRSRGRR
jgi:integrase/recombinase XerD